MGRRRNDRQRDDNRCGQGECLGEGKRSEQFSLGPDHREHRQETDDGGRDGGQHRAGDLAGCPVYHFQAIFLRFGIVQVLEDVLAEDDPHVDHRTDGDGDARKGNDVGVDAEDFHGDKAHQHRQRQQRTDQQRTAQVHHHYQNDDDRDQDFLGQRGVQRTQGLVNQARAVVEWDDGQLAGGNPVGPLSAWRGPHPGQPCLLVQFRSVVGFDPVVLGERFHLLASSLLEVDDHLCRHPRRDLGDLPVDVFDGFQRVEAVSDHDHSADGLGPLLVQRPAPHGRAKRDPGNVLDVNRNVVVDRDNRIFQILNVFDKTEAADKVLDLVDFDGPRTHVDVRHADGHEHVFQAHSGGAHGVRIDVDLVLLHEPADRSHFTDAVGRHQRVADVPVLLGPQLAQIPSADRPSVRVASFERIPEDLPQRGRVGAQRRSDAFRQCVRGKTIEFFQYAGARPVKLDILLED